MGPGTIESLPALEPDTWVIKMTEPGIYTYLIDAVDDLGITYSDSVSVLAMDQVRLDNMLKSRWQKMKTAMAAGDIDMAVSQFTYGQQETFRQILTLQSDKLAQIAAEMQDIEFIFYKNDTAEYRIKKDMLVNGITESITFYLYFDWEEDGIWRIRDF